MGPFRWKQTVAKSWQLWHQVRTVSTVSLGNLPNHVEFNIQAVFPSGSVKKNVHPVLSDHEPPSRGPERKLFWVEKPRTVLFVKKPKDMKSTYAATRMSKWLSREHGIKCLVKPELAEELEGCPEDTSHIYTYSAAEEKAAEYIPRIVDLVITLGGDGTILHAASLFQDRMPPLLPFAMGTLGFLTPFRVADYKKTLNECLDIYTGMHATKRQRLECLILEEDDTLRTYEHRKDRFLIMNDVVVRRFSRPIVLPISATVDGLDLVQYGGDGLVIATPTGSTAYSMACGGSLVHPCIEGILFTPICPSSALNRPSIMRDDSVFCVEVKRPASVIADGHSNDRILRPGQKLQVTRSSSSVYTIHSQDDISAWISDINECLRWNEDLNERRASDAPAA